MIEGLLTNKMRTKEPIRLFGDSFYTGKTNIYKAEIDQTNLLENMVEFTNKKMHCLI